MQGQTPKRLLLLLTTQLSLYEAAQYTQEKVGKIMYSTKCLAAKEEGKVSLFLVTN
jgi:hypothetical protein